MVTIGNRTTELQGDRTVKPASLAAWRRVTHGPHRRTNETPRPIGIAVRIETRKRPAACDTKVSRLGFHANHEGK